MKSRVLAAVIGSVVLSPSAFAQEAQNFYWWVGYGTSTSEDDYGLTKRLGVVQGKIGYRATPNLGVEAEGALGVDEDEFITFNGLNVKGRINSEAGLFVVGFLPLGSSFDLFGRAGLARIEVEASYQNVTASDTQNGAGVGAGLIWNVGPLDVRGEYTLYDFDGKSNSYMLSVGGKF